MIRSKSTSVSALIASIVRRLNRLVQRLASACSAQRDCVSLPGAPAQCMPEVFTLFEDDEWTYAVVRLPKGKSRNLSPRQLEVAKLACQGYTTEGIGTRLQMSKGTADSHLRRIYRKLGIHSRTELACFSGVLGQLEPDLEDPEP